MKKYLFITILLVSSFLLHGQFTAREVSRFGSIPDLISFQGRLTDNTGTPVNEDLYFTFSVYDSESGIDPLWMEVRFVEVNNGLFQVNLGELVDLNESYFEADTRWLGVRIGSDAEMTPRIRITSVPYALKALETDPTWSGDADLSGDIGRSGSVGIGTVSPAEKLHLEEGNFLITGTHGSGSTITPIGEGTRMFFYPRQSAFRAGYINGDQWNNINIGEYSVAMGRNTQASGQSSVALGDGAKAFSPSSFATGFLSEANGWHSIAMGRRARAFGNYSFAVNLSDVVGPNVPAHTFHISNAENTIISEGNVGIGTDSPIEKFHLDGGIFLVKGTHLQGPMLSVNGEGSRMFFFPLRSAFRAGNVTGEQWNAYNVGYVSVAMGWNTIASGYASTAMGYEANALGNYSTAIGWNSTASGVHSVALGLSSIAVGNYSTAMGRQSRAANDHSFAINLSSSLGPEVAANSFRISGAAEIGGNQPWTSHSDRRHKREIENLQEEDNLAKILRLNGIRFRWNDYDRNLNLGFIAQDVEDIVPESVRYDEINDIYSMEYTALIPVLVEAIKEQQKQIIDMAEEHKKQIDELLQRINVLENR